MFSIIKFNVISQNIDLYYTQKLERKKPPSFIELTCSKKYDATVSGQLFVDATSNQSTFLEYLKKTETVQYQ